MARSLLVLVFHPDFAASRVNRVMAERIAGLDGISIRDVYAHYPDFDVDVPTEQALCEKHAIIVFQHPIQWYGCPSLMKEWIDRVLSFGWAHGPRGTRLRGKQWLSAVTAGWKGTDYRHDGRNGATLLEFLKPLSQTAAYCGMQWLEPHILYDARHTDGTAIDAHAQAYRERLLSLRDETN